MESRSKKASYVLAVLKVGTYCGLLCSPQLIGQTDSASKPTQTEQPSGYQLQVKSNLVVVRVVVRDAQGKPVAGLHKENFRLLDRGKEQTISQFDVETSAAPSADATHVSGQVAAPPQMPAKFLALYFDDLNISDTDMMQARNAADKYLAASLQSKDRVAIFNSATMLSDFTADPKQIHDALFNLRTSPRALSRIRECPDISDYQAQQIEQFEDDQTIDAWRIALDEMKNNPSCAGVSNPIPYIQMQARNILAQAQILARTNLQVLERMVQYVAQMPGQRTLILVSPGFLSQSEQFALDRIIDRALRSQVVISSLDPKGLGLLMREADASRSYAPMASSGVVGAVHASDSDREAIAGDVLAEVAEGTGGEFFHNNNDLKAGFNALGGSPIYYILAFAPSDAKLDGKFHALKVTLAQKEKGVTIQARRGYFAPKNEAEAAAAAKQPTTSNAEAQAQEQIREAVVAKTDMQQLPVALGAKVSEMKSGKRDLSLYAHLDAKPLHFHKDGEQSLNTITFVFAIFDEKGKLVDSQERHARITLLDEQMPALLKSGVDASMTFQVKPGIYRIREVVADSEDHHMTTFSKDVTIP
jgi:VWFA-related protein